ncbi:hypothetical protein VP01_628g3 [Puccinia sorghi]|uniref:Uncharacterized protein n=1 Tax=Puccinia sorghi TaxID=27349 RepID=A0A0L6UGD6_9BASI|nr:hypothetical protein VP01_628g3 [Puccinia sorghi]
MADRLHLPEAYNLEEKNNSNSGKSTTHSSHLPSYPHHVCYVFISSHAHSSSSHQLCHSPLVLSSVYLSAAARIYCCISLCFSVFHFISNPNSSITSSLMLTYQSCYLPCKKERLVPWARVEARIHFRTTYPYTSSWLRVGYFRINLHEMNHLRRVANRKANKLSCAWCLKPKSDESYANSLRFKQAWIMDSTDETMSSRVVIPMYRKPPVDATNNIQTINGPGGRPWASPEPQARGLEGAKAAMFVVSSDQMELCNIEAMKERGDYGYTENYRLSRSKIGQAWSHQRFHGPPERFFSHCIEAIKGPLWPRVFVPPAPTILTPKSSFHSSSSRFSHESSPLSHYHCPRAVHSYLTGGFTVDVLIRARAGRATSHKLLVDPFVQYRKIPSPFYFIQPTPAHHTRIPELRCSDASKVHYSIIFGLILRTNSHFQYPLEARAVGSRKASSSYLDVGSILSKCGFSRLKGLLQADKIQAFILMSLVFKTILSPNVATSSLAFPVSLVSMKADWTDLTAKHRFVSSFLIIYHIYLGCWVGMSVVSLQGSRCKHSLLLLFVKPLDPVVHITGSISGVDRQSERSHSSSAEHDTSRPFFLVQPLAGAKTARSTSDHANIPPFVSH